MIQIAFGVKMCAQSRAIFKRAIFGSAQPCRWWSRIRGFFARSTPRNKSGKWMKRHFAWLTVSKVISNILSFFVMILYWTSPQRSSLLTKSNLLHFRKIKTIEILILLTVHDSIINQQNFLIKSDKFTNSKWVDAAFLKRSKPNDFWPVTHGCCA